MLSVAHPALALGNSGWGVPYLGVVSIWSGVLDAIGNLWLDLRDVCICCASLDCNFIRRKRRQVVRLILVWTGAWKKELYDVMASVSWGF